MLVLVDKLIVPVDFVIMEMENCLGRNNEPVILLRRPFMATIRTIIDVHNGRLSMTVIGENVQLDVFNAMSVTPQFPLRFLRRFKSSFELINQH